MQGLHTHTHQLSAQRFNSFLGDGDLKLLGFPVRRPGREASKEGAAAGDAHGKLQASAGWPGCPDLRGSRAEQRAQWPQPPHAPCDRGCRLADPSVQHLRYPLNTRQAEGGGTEMSLIQYKQLLLEDDFINELSQLQLS